MTPVNYTKLDHNYRRHHARYKTLVETKYAHLWCMECRGSGGWTEIIDPEIGGPWFQCGWCEGTGLMTPFLRGRWLTMMKQEKAKKVAQ